MSEDLGNHSAPGLSGGTPNRPSSRRRHGPVKTLVVSVAVFAIGTLLYGRATTRASAPPPPADVPRVDGNRIVFSESYRQRVGLRDTVARSGTLIPLVSVVGTTAVNPQHSAAVGTRLNGLVRRVLKYEGDSVRAGELLAEIDSAELGQAEAGASALRAQKDTAELNAKRERELAARNLSTAREAEVAESKLKEFQALLSSAEQRVQALGGSSARLGLQQMRSPISGTVLARSVSPGQSVVGDLTAFKIANLDYLWVELHVTERAIRRIRAGDEVELEALGDPAEKIEGRVAHVGAQIDPGTRSADVRVEVDNRSRKLRAGEAVKARIRASAKVQQSVTLVPLRAVAYIDGKPVVFLADGPLAVRATTVELGEADDSHQQVLAGLKAGETVIVDGVFDLKSELFR